MLKKSFSLFKITIFKWFIYNFFLLRQVKIIILIKEIEFYASSFSITKHYKTFLTI